MSLEQAIFSVFPPHQTDDELADTPNQLDLPPLEGMSLGDIVSEALAMIASNDFDDNATISFKQRASNATKRNPMEPRRQ